MNIIAADDERIALQLLVSTIHEALPEANVYDFSSGEDALAFGSKSLCEIAFLDIDMSNIDGITLAKRLKHANPKINIIFVTAHSQYAIEALALHSSGYIMKPATKEKIERELENLRHPILMPTKHNIWIQCFGNFEVYADGVPVKFTYNKTKELLAFLVDRKGALCTNAEIITALWEDTKNSVNKNSYLRDLRSDLISTFSSLNAEKAIRKQRGAMAVAVDHIACDYYNWMEGNLQSINAYRGEYMSQYSWGEFTLGGIKLTMPEE